MVQVFDWGGLLGFLSLVIVLIMHVGHKAFYVLLLLTLLELEELDGFIAQAVQTTNCITKRLLGLVKPNAISALIIDTLCWSFPPQHQHHLSL